MNQDQLKQQVAAAAADYVERHLPAGGILGVGTGSTANCFIDALADLRDRIGTTVASSEASAKRLRALGLPVEDLNNVGGVDIYVDGADEINERLEMIKGGGAALTREKIVAGASSTFVCIVDESKWVRQLGAFPLPVEVIPMARSFVARELVKLGAEPVYRSGVTTDNGNVILDLHNFTLTVPRKLEEQINNIPGVVTNGIFGLRPADVALVGTDQGVDQRRATP